MSWGCQRDLFDVPDEVAYFNAASLSPVLHSVRAAGEAALGRRARPWEIGEADWFADVERLRGLAGRLVGGDAEGIALVPATSYGFAVAAANLPLATGQQILILAGEYPSGVYTWRRLAERTGAVIRTVTRAPGLTWTEAVLAAIDERVAIVSVPNVHWIDGGLVDLAQVAARTRAAGARLVVDASQSLGVMPLDVAALRPRLCRVGWLQVVAGPVRTRVHLGRRRAPRGPAPRGELDRAGPARRTSPSSWTTETSTCPARGGTTRAPATLSN